LVTPESSKKALERYSPKQAKSPTLEKVMVEMGFITRSQAIRLVQSIRESSKSRPIKYPVFQILGKLGQGAMAVYTRPSTQSRQDSGGQGAAVEVHREPSMSLASTKKASGGPAQPPQYRAGHRRSAIGWKALFRDGYVEGRPSRRPCRRQDIRRERSDRHHPAGGKSPCATPTPRN